MEWGREVRIRTAFQYFCNDRYKQLNDFFMQYGYVIYPYVCNETYKKDDSYIPPPKLKLLHINLTNIFSELYRNKITKILKGV
jgi:hypothetical protein